MSLFFFKHSFISDTFCSFWLFFCSCFMKNTYYLPKLMLLNFCCQKTSVPWKHKFFVIDKKYSQLNLDNKLKVFHESILGFMKCPWNCILWNNQKDKFLSVSLPTLQELQMVLWRKQIGFTEFERKINVKITPTLSLLITNYVCSKFLLNVSIL